MMVKGYTDLTLAPVGVIDLAEVPIASSSLSMIEEPPRIFTL